MNVSAEPERCIIVLGTKSSGTTVVRDVIATDPHVRELRYTPHYEGESLFFFKAAAALSMELRPLVHSAMASMPADGGARRLSELVSGNGGEWDGERSADAVAHAWISVRKAHTPYLVEKSPHHLCQRSALELLEQAIQLDSEADYDLVLITRDPMDTLASAWDRWGYPPEEFQFEWLASMENLVDLESRLPRTVRVRYEEPDLRPLGLDLDSDRLHRSSVGRWKESSVRHFRPDPRVVAIADELGYDTSEYPRQDSIRWSVAKSAAAPKHAALRMRRRVHLRQMKRP